MHWIDKKFVFEGVHIKEVDRRIAWEKLDKEWTCGRQTARISAQSTTLYGVSCRNEFTRLQCVTQLISNSASLRLAWAFHRLSSTKSLTSGATTTSLRQSKGTSLRTLAVTNRLFSEPPTFYRRKWLCRRMLEYLIYSVVTNTLSIHSYMHRGIKIGALKMQLVCIFFHIWWISAENLKF